MSTHYAINSAPALTGDQEVDLDTVVMLAHCTTAFASTRLAVGELDAVRARHRRDLMLRTIRKERPAALLSR